MALALAMETKSKPTSTWSGQTRSQKMLLFSTCTPARTRPPRTSSTPAFAIDKNLAPVISTSYGNCEAHLTGFVQTLQQEAQQANAQGQTITAASGDSGAGDCEAASVTTATQGPAVDAPASIPEVTGIGGSSSPETPQVP